MTDSVFSLKGRIALVTGAARGLGWEIAKGFARAGAHVLINARRAEQVEPKADELRQQGYQASALAFDVGDAQESIAALKKVDTDFGRLDILVNNVGVRLRIPLEQTTPEAFHDLLDVNLTAPFRLTRLAAELMRRNGYGRIIMIGSVAADRAAPGNIAYIAAKGGLAAMTRAFACEYGPLGITCNTLSPGSFATETNAAAAASPVGKALNDRIPLRRWGRPEELAGPALFLASEAGSYVNGHLLVVDGGLSTSF
jgi:gluconate 5-dehydrogenase